MKTILILLTGLLTGFHVCSQVRLPAIFGDHMVIQRNLPVPVWGWSSPGEKIIIKFNHQSKQTTANRNGKWRINLDPEPAGGPYEISIQGRNTRLIHDVLVGEVWICSGQSNMEFQLRSVLDADSEIRGAEYPEIRHIKIPLSVSGTPNDDIQPASWNICSYKTAGEFTAVGYFFARELVKRLHVPVGLINSTWGGTMVETWTSRGAFEKSPDFKSMIAGLNSGDLGPMMKERQLKLQNQYRLLQKNIHDSIPEYEWKNPGYNGNDWPRKSGNINRLDWITWMELFGTERKLRLILLLSVIRSCFLWEKLMIMMKPLLTEAWWVQPGIGKRKECIMWPPVFSKQEKI